MKAGVLHIQINFSMCSYETKIVKSRSCDSVNGHPFCNIKVKCTQKQCTKIILITLFQYCLQLFTIDQAVRNLVIIYKKKQYKIYIFIHFLAKLNDNFIQKNNLVRSSAFCFEIPGDILVQCSQNQYYLTKLYCLSNISPSIEAAPKLANLSSALTK